MVDCNCWGCWFRDERYIHQIGSRDSKRVFERVKMGGMRCLYSVWGPIHNLHSVTTCVVWNVLVKLRVVLATARSPFPFSISDATKARSFDFEHCAPATIGGSRVLL